MSSLDKVLSTWDDWMNKKSDPRTTDWLLMESPFPTVALCVFYVLSIKVWLPKLMSNRKPFKMEFIQWLTNLWFFAGSVFFFYKSTSLGWFTYYNWRCQPVDTSLSGPGYKMAEATWMFFFFKMTYFLESVVYVLCNNSHLNSNYFVIHHATIPISVWFVTKYIPGGHASFFGFANCFFHMIIFGYYVFLAFFPQIKKISKSWWPKAITCFHVAQLVTFFLHTFQLVLWNDCNFPMAYVYGVSLQAVVLFIIFAVTYL